MAKTQTNVVQMGGNRITLASLSAIHRKAINAIRTKVTTAARDFGAVRERLTDLAPKVVNLFKGIETAHDGFTFVEFARMFDASVPTHARPGKDGKPGYQAHRVYYTLAYMKRIVQTARTGKTGQQGIRDTATDQLARTIATILQITPDPEQVWNALQSEFDLTERLMTRLRNRVKATQPLFALEAPKVKVGKVVHMTPAPAAPVEALAQGGRKVKAEAA